MSVNWGSPTFTFTPLMFSPPCPNLATPKPSPLPAWPAFLWLRPPPFAAPVKFAGLGGAVIFGLSSAIDGVMIEFWTTSCGGAAGASGMARGVSMPRPPLS